MKTRLLFLSVVVVCLSAVAAQAQLNLNSVDGDWANPVGGAYISYVDGVAVSYGNGSQDQIRWGYPPSAPSGLGFTGSTPPAAPISLGTPFQVGELVHFNNPISSGTWVSAVDLILDLTVTNGNTESQSFTFQFLVNETPNTTGDPWQDRDIITFPVAYASELITIDSQEYTLWLLGFGSDAGHLLPEFASPEGGSNTTLLWGEIAPVPVPGAVLLGVLGLGAAGLKLRKRA